MFYSLTRVRQLQRSARILQSFNTLRTFISYPSLKMEKSSSRAIIHQDEDRITFSVVVENPDLNIVGKQINMNRSIDEPGGTFIKRLNASIEKIVQKKKRKVKKVKLANSSGEAVEVEDLEEAIPNYATFKKAGLELSMNTTTPISELFSLTETGGKADIKMNIFEKTYSVDINPPIVKSLKLSGSIMEGFPVYPFKLEVENADEAKSNFEWHVSEKSFTEEEISSKNFSTMHLAWQKASTERTYIPQIGDIGRFLKLVCVPRNESGEKGCPEMIISKNVITAGPGVCPFETRHKFTSALTEPGTVRFVTYNILADLYADSDYSREVLHPRCPPHALEIDYRKQLLLKEISGYNADIICLQEVDSKVFKNDLEPAFSQYGLKGDFYRKGGQVNEGEACFWRESKFELVSSDRLVLAEGVTEFEHLAEFKEAIAKNEKLNSYFMERSNILQSVVLQSREDPKKRVIVGNTHLFFFPEADQIRLLQAGACLRHLQYLLKKEQSEHPDKSVSIFLCGDFNSTPECGVYQLLCTGPVDKDHADWAMMAEMKVENFSLAHDLAMASACGTPKYTNYTLSFRDCLDYIFYQTDAFSVKEVVPFPSEEELALYQGSFLHITAIPNITFPSDHIACVVDLEWKN